MCLQDHFPRRRKLGGITLSLPVLQVGKLFCVLQSTVPDSNVPLFYRHQPNTSITCSIAFASVSISSFVL